MKQLMLRFAEAVSQFVKPERPVRDEDEGLLSPAERAFFRSKNRELIGRWAEDTAAEFLRKQGVKILDRNVRERFSEIDIVGDDDGELIFAEVRCRRANPVMSALDTLGPQKWRRLARRCCSVAALPAAACPRRRAVCDAEAMDRQLACRSDRS